MTVNPNARPLSDDNLRIWNSHGMVATNGAVVMSRETLESMLNDARQEGRDGGEIDAMRHLLETPDSAVSDLLGRAHLAAGHPADDDDLSNDADIGRRFIKLRHRIALMIRAAAAPGATHD